VVLVSHKRKCKMSILDDLTKTLEGSIVSGMSERLGLDPNTAQGLVDKFQGGHDEGGAEAPNLAEATEASQVLSDVQETQEGFLGKAISMLDKDGDGNLINEAKSVLGGLVNRQT
jgi:hypothetical protein